MKIPKSSELSGSIQNTVSVFMGREHTLKITIAMIHSVRDLLLTQGLTQAVIPMTVQTRRLAIIMRKTSASTVAILRHTP